uniref:Tryptophan synthase beta chain-like PALP domain-containing protein n=1 Tax=Aegilops tauschii subsp. strangulata TaxID=200361 RepID=A0A453FB24_AEGTS
MRPAPVLAAGGRTVGNILSATEWMLPSPATQVHTISVLPSHSPSPAPQFAFSNLTTASKSSGGKGDQQGTPRFDVVRDDLLHPLANGNKARKLDALLPLLRRRGATDVITCGGCQSAHAAAVGVMRLVEHLSCLSSFHNDEEVHIVVDAGTGTTAVGLALGAVCLGLHWRVTAVMLADTLERYQEQEKSLISDFKGLCHEDCHHLVGTDGLVHWVDRSSPRRFGKVLGGEIASCRQVARQTGILLDPVYTLAAWEQAVDLCRGDGREAKVAMIHTGGTLGLFGLAQRYPQHFAATANGQA